MADWDEVVRLASELPEVEAADRRDWKVKGKSFIWNRPLRKRDLDELGDAAPSEPILAAWVADALAKEALIASAPDIYFTTSHFDGYAIVLIRLTDIPVEELEEVIVEAWLSRAPKRLAAEYLAAE